MPKYSTVVALAGLLLATGAPVTAESFKVVADRMTRFYLTPTREEFDSIQRGIQAHFRKFKAEEKENGTATLAAVFLARVREKYHYALLDIGDLDDEAKSIVANDGSEIASFVHDDSRVSPEKLDIWWISYFATGETHYLDKILEQVGDVKSQSGVARILVVGAANWSLASNCEQHPAVLEHVRSVLERTPPPTNADALRDVIAGLGKHG